MPTDWMYWLSSLHLEELVALFIGLLVLDAPRYAISRVVMCLWDFSHALVQWAQGTTPRASYTYCPSVCVDLAGYNEAETVGATLESIYGTYPKMEIIVVDDGSADGMARVAHQFAKNHSGVQVLSRPDRGGKSSAMNFALPYTKAEVIVNIDTDSELGPAALWEMVQPLQDPDVGAVSATILARNPFANLCTWLQAYEYLHSIFVGRMLAERLGLLGIASGAFAAIRRTALDQVMGWDVGPPEDLDLTLRIRKSGYKIAFAPYAICYTDLPATWKGLVKQRLRWDQGAVIRNHCRKHVDMANLFSRNFRFRDFLLLVDNWIFQLFCSYAFVAYVLWYCFDPPADIGYIVVGLYFCAVLFELLQVATLMFYSIAPARDALICAVFPLVPIYQLAFMFVRAIANTQELLFRSSFDDNYVPKKVREATWRW
jgi:poly-beta-1,6-N-acetyl-D-glucosamine synthase